MNEFRRRVLVPRDRVRQLIRGIRADAWASHYDTMAELRRLQVEMAALRAEYDALCNAVRERERAEADLELMKRDRERQMAIAEGKVVWLH
jgi:hypothetical protein